MRVRGEFCRCESRLMPDDADLIPVPGVNPPPDPATLRPAFDSMARQSCHFFKSNETSSGDFPCTQLD